MYRVYNNKTLLQLTYENAYKINPNIIIATGDKVIFNEASKWCNKVFFTKYNHISGTSRICEVLKNLQLNCNDIIVNIQGDEPLVLKKHVESIVRKLLNNIDINISTISTNLSNEMEVDNKNIVKVVLNIKNNAIYFSRLPIPYCRDDKKINKKFFKKHIGIFAYKLNFLINYDSKQFCDIENLEKLEQLKMLWIDEKIAVSVFNDFYKHCSIDSFYDIKELQNILYKK